MYKMNSVLNIFVCVLFGAISLAASSEKKVICYYGTWATYRWGLGKFDVDNINVDLCTHVVYTFVGLNSDGTIAILDPYLDLPDNWGKDNFGKFNALKQQNSNLKTILAVGGWNEGSAKYSIMAANPSLRQTFVKSAVNLLLEHGFDGFDVDWEYPNRRDTVNGQADVDNFTLLLKELKQALKSQGLSLSIAVSAVRQSASFSYDVPAICQYADHIGLMTYDLYGPWDLKTGHNAGLHQGEGDESLNRENLFTVDVAVEYWLSAGCPPEKLILGLPLYGRTFTLTNPDVNGVRAPSSGVGIAGQFTATNGFIGYNEFCTLMQQESWDVRYDDQAKVPYATKGRNWVSFDDPDSLAAKVHYGVDLKLGGAMVWSIETDDFHGLCHDDDFPLLRAINIALGRDINGLTTSSSTTTTPNPTATPTTTTPYTTTTPSATTTTTFTTTTPTSTSSPTTTPTTTPPITTTTTEVTTSTSTETTDSSSSTATDESSSSTPCESASTTTVKSTTTSSTSTAVPPMVCQEEGVRSHPQDCSKFFYCVRNEEYVLEPVEFSCPNNLLWDQTVLSCNYASNVECSNI